MMLSMAGGGLFMLAILWRYIQSRRRLDSWHVRYGQETNSTANSTKPQQPKQQGIYDRWLLIRFTIGFVFLGLVCLMRASPLLPADARCQDI